MGKQRQQQDNVARSSAYPKPSRPEVSPKRKKRKGSRHPHSTDLQDLGQATPSEKSVEPQSSDAKSAEDAVPRVFSPQISRLVRRPVAELPRKPSFFVRFGPPMTAE